MPTPPRIRRPSLEDASSAAPAVLDYQAYPHVFEDVVAQADRAGLLALRGVSSGVRRMAEARLFEHVAIVLDTNQDPAMVVLTEPRAPFRRLPFLVPKLHKTLLKFAAPNVWEPTLRAIRVVDVHAPPNNEQLRHLITLLAPVAADPEGIRIMRRRELGGRYLAEDVHTKLQTPTAIAYLDFRAEWPPLMTITSPHMRRVVVHVSLQSMRDPWVIRPRDYHGCKEAVIVMEPTRFYPPALSITMPQYLFHLVRYFFQWSKDHTVVTIVGLEHFRPDIDRAMGEIRDNILPNRSLVDKIVAMSYDEWSAREGADAALEIEGHLPEIQVGVC